ncbi:hypothetical protein SH2C18_20010 [Clostridium sediminicola]|uniref:hypothetical protein n=1 Tax=Clostridium sediminicola TaxID=3114879 RepID=UPI0031F20258
MKIRELLDELNSDELKNIALNYGLMDEEKDKNIHKHELKKRLETRRLTVRKELKWITDGDKSPNKIKLDKSMILDLKRLAFGFSPSIISNKNKIFLKELGLLYKGKYIPEETSIIFREIFREEFVCEIDDFIIEVKYSYFLKLILYINLIIHKDNLNSRELKKLESKNKLLKSFMISKNFIGVNDYNLNKEKVRDWIDSNNIFDLYKDISEKQSKNIEDIKNLLNIIEKMQGNANKWIDKEKLDFVLEYYKDEFEYCKELGLIFDIDKENKKYTKLSGEAWVMLTNEIPKEWHTHNNVVTSDFEVMIPFTSNPYSILKLITYSKLQNKNEDFLLIFDISPKSFNDYDQTITYEEFIKELGEIIDDLPDIVKKNYCI